MDMRHANITGWGKCCPPAVLNNNDLTTFLDTDEAWIEKMTGMQERRISHVHVDELGAVAASQALAAAGKTAEDVDMIIFGSTSPDMMAPNSASGVQKMLGCEKAAAMDLNTACTSGMYGLSVATAMIGTGAINSAIVIGAEVISKFMDWEDRSVAILFGDGAAAFYLEASDEPCGVMAETLGCYADVREILYVNGHGSRFANDGWMTGCTKWDFEGQEIFKKAVKGMHHAVNSTLEKANKTIDDIQLLVPHQANIRIIDSLGKKLGVPADKVFVNIERYGNMSAATAPIALVEAIEEGRVQANDHIVMPAFGGGLAWSAHLIRWGERTTPLGHSDMTLPACNDTGLEIVNKIRAARAAH